MELITDFETFLKEIRPTENQRQDMQTGHKTLRERLRGYEGLKDIYISDFLQGSYKRHTAVRPKGDKKSDVDIIVVTNMREQEYTPQKAMDRFKPFLEEYYKGKYRQQGRSYGITLSYVEMDLVVTSAPSEATKDLYKSAAVTTLFDIVEAADWRLNKLWVDPSERFTAAARQKVEEAKKAEEWKLAPLRIPDREAKKWDDTHPLAQIVFTREKNRVCDGHFVNVVKSLKWWRMENNGDNLRHPKSFPLERLIGECCPTGIASVAKGVTYTLETIVDNYALYANAGLKPTLPDYGVPGHDVFRKVTAEEFKEFYDQAKDGAKLARKALDSTDRTESGDLWRELLGDKFPKPPEEKGAFQKPAAAATPETARFA
jgi:hypothetical protein